MLQWITTSDLSSAFHNGNKIISMSCVFWPNTKWNKSNKIVFNTKAITRVMNFKFKYLEEWQTCSYICVWMQIMKPVYCLSFAKVYIKCQMYAGTSIANVIDIEIWTNYIIIAAILR